MAGRAMSLSLGYSMAMPSNYIPWGGPGPINAQQELFKEAQAKVKTIAGPVLRQEQGTVDRGPLWQNILFSLIYKMSFQKIRNMDKKFWADAKCDGCGICSQVCPAANIDMINDKPAWLHHCEQCLACLQWCPREAIQYGEKTAQYPRYHHPEITLKDMLEQAKATR
jgi:ferredoxin